MVRAKGGQSALVERVGNSRLNVLTVSFLPSLLYTYMMTRYMCRVVVVLGGDDDDECDGIEMRNVARDARVCWCW